MEDSALEWYLSHSGPRVSVITKPELGAVARAVAVWAYDPDHPREASRVIAEMTRGDVAYAVDAALQENPLLLSPKKREQQPRLPAAADGRLTALARKRIREPYSEIEHAERAAEGPFFDREAPSVRKILDGYYPGSGGGRPRVPDRYPLMLKQIMSGLLEVSAATKGSSREALGQL